MSINNSKSPFSDAERENIYNQVVYIKELAEKTKQNEKPTFIQPFLEKVGTAYLFGSAASLWYSGVRAPRPFRLSYLFLSRSPSLILGCTALGMVQGIYGAAKQVFASDIPESPFSTDPFQKS